jgi:hypothetical protein
MISRLIVIKTIVVLGVAVCGLVPPSYALEAPQLELDDCQKCHTRVIRTIETAGGKHRDVLSCIDCHQEHPPRGANAIPACALCHESDTNEHFAVSDCLGCHNPHKPLKIDFKNASRVAPACKSCHPEQATELLEYSSYHSVLDCKDCHQVHGEYLDCLACHDPHLEKQTYADCRRCHQPHSPMKVVYNNTLASEHCTACHAEPGAKLQQTTTKHRLLLCVYCHKSQHKRVPKCETCHYQPHVSGMHDKFPDCVTCHVSPHNLVN